MKLQGVIVPLVTPLNPDESLDEDSLSRLIEHVIGGGVNGVFVLGTSGECATLEDEVKTHLVRGAIERIEGRGLVLAGAIEPSTHRTVTLAQRWAALGVDAVVIAPPYYYRYTQAELIMHCRTVAQAVDIPVVLYDNPEMFNHFLTPDTVDILADEPNIIGLKDSAGDMARFQAFLLRRDKQQGFTVCMGAEELAALGMVRGADALVLGMANPAPRLCAELYEAAKAGDLSRAWDLQRKVSELRTLQTNGYWLACLKNAMSQLGLCGPTVTAPVAPLNQAQTMQVRQTLKAAGLINDERKT